MTKYVVLVQGNTATIALDGYEPHGAGEQMGSFSVDVDPLNNQTNGSEITGKGGDHNFIVLAKQALSNNEDFVGNVNNLTFLDKASNAPVHPTDGAENIDLDVVDEMSQTSEKSAQAGGVGTVDAEGKDPNGVVESEERSDADEANNKDENQEDEHDGETVAQLKERLATVTDKDALEADYKAEQEGKNRAGAIAAYEARAAELNEDTQA